jgi:hypothetical protein
MVRGRHITVYALQELDRHHRRRGLTSGHWFLGTFRPTKGLSYLYNSSTDCSRQAKMIPKLPFDAYATRSLFVLRLLVGELLPCPNVLVRNPFYNSSAERGPTARTPQAYVRPCPPLW